MIVYNHKILFWILDPFLLEAVETSQCYFLINWVKKLKCPQLLKPLGTIIQQNYWSFYLSETIQKARFNVRHPVPVKQLFCFKIVLTSHCLKKLFCHREILSQIGQNILICNSKNVERFNWFDCENDLKNLNFVFFDSLVDFVKRHKKDYISF